MRDKMKTTVIIEDGETRIVLTPETEFEKTVIEDCQYGDNRFNTCKISCQRDYPYNTNDYREHKIVLSIIKTPTETK